MSLLTTAAFSQRTFRLTATSTLHCRIETTEGLHQQILRLLVRSGLAKLAYMCTHMGAYDGRIWDDPSPPLTGTLQSV